MLPERLRVAPGPSALSSWAALVQERRPTGIVLTMIVKNEAKVIARALRSALPFVDGVMIHDTGSTDDTLDVVDATMRDHRASGELADESAITWMVERVPWTDFATNRNLVLDAARREFPQCPYHLWMDADDQLLLVAPWTGLPKPGELERYDLSVTDVEWDESYWRPHIFRADRPANGMGGWRWYGPVHEYLSADGPIHEAAEKAEKGDIQPRRGARLYGLRYLRIGGGSRSKNPEKNRKDAALLQAEIKKDPKDARSWFYLARAFEADELWRPALECYAHRATMEGDQEEVFLSVFGVARMKEALYATEDEVRAAYQEAHDLRTRAEPMTRLSLYLYEKGDYQAATSTGEIAMRLAQQRPPDQLFVDDSVYRWKATMAFAQAAAKLPHRTVDAGRAAQRILDKVPPAELPNLRAFILHCQSEYNKAMAGPEKVG